MTEISTLWEKIIQYDNFLLCLHEYADGDSLCSNIAMAELLIAHGKTVSILRGKNKQLPKGFDSFSDWCNLISDKSVEDVNLEEYGCFLMLDISREERLHSLGSSITIPKIVIDHHAGNSIENAVASLIDPSRSSTAELVYEIGRSKGPHSSSFLLAVYLGIWSDTMGLRYNLTPRVMEMMTDLVKEIGDPEPYVSAYEQSWEGNDFAMVRIGLGKAKPGTINSIPVVVCQISLYDKRSNFLSDNASTDALIKVMQNSSILDVLIIAEEVQNSVWRIRIRSYQSGRAKAVSEKLGGTGHEKSAGATVSGDSDQVEKMINEACADVFYS